MKNPVKIIITVILVTVATFGIKASTPVSGGIYSNTTWTLANSPYIVTDTVVVFPGVTLTIEPGVVVKFDSNIRLEIRQATLIAQGTAADSITFTSSAGSPTPGIWGDIYLNGGSLSSIFNYCNFYYASIALLGGKANVQNCNFKNNGTGYDGWGIIDSSLFINNIWDGAYLLQGRISNSNFINNKEGIEVSISSMDTVIIENSTIDSNVTGIYIYQSDNLLKIINCSISYNSHVGIDSYPYGIYRLDLTQCQIRYDSIGLNLSYYLGNIFENIFENNVIGIRSNPDFSNIQIYCNKICNNTSYDFYNNSTYVINIPNNYWCTTDSASTEALIYDGYDNISLGLVHFMPIDTIGCYLNGCSLSVSATVTNASCDTCHDGIATGHAAYGFPPYTWTWYTSPIQTTQTASELAPGTYHFCVTDSHGCTACDSNIVVDTTSCNGFSAQVNATTASCNTCNDGSATVQVNGGSPPFQYVWNIVPPQYSSIASGLFPGIYSVCITDNNACTTCDTFQVFSLGNCLAYFHLYPDTTTPHHYFAVNMASGVPPIAWYWNWGDGTHDTTAYPSHTYATAGFYIICLTITDGGGCINTYCDSFYLQKSLNTMVTVNVISNITTGINALNNDNSFSLYPNPATDNLTIETHQKATIEIRNIQGQLIKTLAVSGNKMNIDVAAFPCGVYIVEMKTEKGVGVRKFVKE